MPIFSDLSLYYTGSSSSFSPSLYVNQYTSPLPSYTSRSGLYGGYGLPPTPRLLTTSRITKYIPPLPSISESSTLYHISRITSPRAAAAYRPPKPIDIDTDTIDVTTPRNRDRLSRDRDDPQQGTIKRGRTVVRLHTKRLKDNPSFQPRKKTPGEKLVEKFLIRDKGEEEAKRRRREEDAYRSRHVYKEEESVVIIPVEIKPVEDVKTHRRKSIQDCLLELESVIGLDEPEREFLRKSSLIPADSPDVSSKEESESEALDRILSETQKEDADVAAKTPEPPPTPDDLLPKTISVKSTQRRSSEKSGTVKKRPKKRDKNETIKRNKSGELPEVIDPAEPVEKSLLQRRNTKKIRRNSRDLELLTLELSADHFDRKSSLVTTPSDSLCSSPSITVPTTPIDSVLSTPASSLPSTPAGMSTLTTAEIFPSLKSSPSSSSSSTPPAPSPSPSPALSKISSPVSSSASTPASSAPSTPPGSAPGTPTFSLKSKGEGLDKRKQVPPKTKVSNRDVFPFKTKVNEVKSESQSAKKLSVDVSVENADDLCKKFPLKFIVDEIKIEEAPKSPKSPIFLQYDVVVEDVPFRRQSLDILEDITEENETDVEFWSQEDAEAHKLSKLVKNIYKPIEQESEKKDCFPNSESMNKTFLDKQQPKGKQNKTNFSGKEEQIFKFPTLKQGEKKTTLNNASNKNENKGKRKPDVKKLCGEMTPVIKKAEKEEIMNGVVILDSPKTPLISQLIAKSEDAKIGSNMDKKVVASYGKWGKGTIEDIDSVQCLLPKIENKIKPESDKKETTIISKTTEGKDKPQQKFKTAKIDIISKTSLENTQNKIDKQHLSGVDKEKVPEEVDVPCHKETKVKEKTTVKPDKNMSLAKKEEKVETLSKVTTLNETSAAENQALDGIPAWKKALLVKNQTTISIIPTEDVKFSTENQKKEKSTEDQTVSVLPEIIEQKITDTIPAWKKKLIESKQAENTSKCTDGFLTGTTKPVEAKLKDEVKSPELLFTEKVKPIESKHEKIMQVLPEVEDDNKRPAWMKELKQGNKETKSAELSPTENEKEVESKTLEKSQIFPESKEKQDDKKPAWMKKLKQLDFAKISPENSVSEKGKIGDAKTEMVPEVKPETAKPAWMKKQKELGTAEKGSETSQSGKPKETESKTETVSTKRQQELQSSPTEKSKKDLVTKAKVEDSKPPGTKAKERDIATKALENLKSDKSKSVETKTNTTHEEVITKLTKKDKQLESSPTEMLKPAEKTENISSILPEDKVKADDSKPAWMKKLAEKKQTAESAMKSSVDSPADKSKPVAIELQESNTVSKPLYSAVLGKNKATTDSIPPSFETTPKDQPKLVALDNSQKPPQANKSKISDSNKAKGKIRPPDLKLKESPLSSEENSPVEKTKTPPFGKKKLVTDAKVKSPDSSPVDKEKSTADKKKISEENKKTLPTEGTSVKDGKLIKTIEAKEQKPPKGKQGSTGPKSPKDKQAVSASKAPKDKQEVLEPKASKDKKNASEPKSPIDKKIVTPPKSPTDKKIVTPPKSPKSPKSPKDKQEKTEPESPKVKQTATPAAPVTPEPITNRPPSMGGNKVQTSGMQSVKRSVYSTRRDFLRKSTQMGMQAAARMAAEDKKREEEKEASSDEDTESEEETETETDDDGEEVTPGPQRASTSSTEDSGIDSLPTSVPGSPACSSKECDVNCHKKCEKLMPNLCGVNQKLIVEALSSLKKGSTSSGSSTDSATPSTALYMNAALDPYDDSGPPTALLKSGRVTPPATTIPRFRKYAVEDFHFLKVLGKGSFGKVLLAELKGTECYYAVKCLKKDVVLEDDDVECTLIERKVLALGTKHPFLCHLFCTFQTESHLFFVMEYLNGGDLMFHIQQSGRFQEPRARFYGAEIVSGLKFLHKKGVVYRDLKLDNIVLDFDGHVRIADFGMCKLQIYLDRTADTFCGTPDYMAPEIIKGLKYNQCVDWWSFGILLYEMLIGQSPFSGCDEDDLFWSICNEAPYFPRFLSREAHAILSMLLEKDSSKRLGTPECTAGDVMDQPFFRNMDWDALERRELDPPFKPRLQHPLDVQYFDKAFTAEPPKLTPVNRDILISMDQTQFQGFSYTNPNATD